MKTVTLKKIERTYKNNGQHAEQAFRFTVTGEICKADNKPAWAGGDCLDIQVKSARATVCKGTDLERYLDLDSANRYAYVNAEITKAYIMSREEYTEFVKKFSYIDRESTKNNGATKIRLKTESKAMKKWLEERA